jgi:WD40 repeat protein
MAMSRTHTLIALVVALPSAWADPATDAHGDPLPPGAVQRLGHNPYHALWQRSAQFTADGKEIVVLRWGVYVSVYDRDTGRLKETRTLPTEPVERFTLLPGGEKALLGQPAWPAESGRPDRYEVWDVRAGRRLGRVFTDNHSASMTPAPDGSFLVEQKPLPSDPGVLKWQFTKWDVRTGRAGPSTTASFHIGTNGYGYRPLAISPDGQFLMHTIYPGTERVSEASCWETGRLTECWRRTFPPDGGNLAFLRPGEAVLMTKTPTGLDLRTGLPTTTRFPPNRDLRHSYVLGPDPNLILYADGASATGGGRIRAWDLKAGAAVPPGPDLRLTRPWTSDFGLSPDGKYLLDYQGGQVHDRATGRALWPVPSADRHRERVQTLTFSADGRRLASGASDGTARVWDLATGRSLGVWPAGPSAWTHDLVGANSTHSTTGPPPLALSADGRRLVVSSTPTGHGVPGPRAYDVETGELLAAAPIPQTKAADANRPAIGQVVFLPGEDSVAVTFDDGMTYGAIWTVARWDYLRAAWSVDGRIPVGFDAGGAFDRAGSLIAGEQVVPVGASGSRFELANGGGPVTRTGDGRFAAGPGDDARAGTAGGLPVWRDIRGWDARTGAVLATAPRLPDPLPDRLRGVDAFWMWPRLFALHPTGRYIVLADAGGVRLWDWATDRVVHRFPFPIMPALEWNHGSPATALAFSPDGSRLATGLPDGTILLWEVPISGPRSLSPETADRLWAELMSDDPAAGWRAAWLLGDDPSAAVRLARKHVAPVEPFPADELRKLLADVESPRFAVRERATARLERAADLIGSVVGEMLKATKSEETRVRLAKVMAAVPGPERPLPAWASALGRAVSVVEHAGGDEARRLLMTWAGGTPDAFLTREAKAALERLAAKR